MTAELVHRHQLVRPRAEGPALPTLEDLRRATARTQRVIENPESTFTDMLRAAWFEGATLHAYEHTPRAKAELEREPEAEAQ